ncbi:hypothetical protein [Paraburkholderia phenoliruptrix]|uniref:hypothetical protein n=1 Tax=Paraburkholderia phenoliruptrix TaxID=252970 RepID=UPI0034CE582F
MAARITVPAGFVQDFDLYCERSRMTPREKEQLRNEVREDFAGWGPVIQRQAAVYRFTDETWGAVLGAGVLPPLKWVIGYLASKGVFLEEGAEKRCGVLLLLDRCAELAGAVPALETAAVPS